jgi:Trp operon repressor
MERIAMSQEERDKLEWLKRAKDKVISQREAAERIGVSGATAKRHGIELSDETVRQWMIGAGLWKSKSRRQAMSSTSLL